MQPSSRSPGIPKAEGVLSQEDHRMKAMAAGPGPDEETGLCHMSAVLCGGQSPHVFAHS